MVTTITGTSISTANLNLGGTFMSDELAKFTSNNYLQTSFSTGPSAGQVIQSKSSTTGFGLTTQSINSSSKQEVSGMRVTITPQYNNSKMLIFGYLVCNAQYVMGVGIYKNGGSLITNNNQTLQTGGSTALWTIYKGTNTAGENWVFPFMYEDTVTNTNSTIYALYANAGWNGGTTVLIVNDRSADDMRSQSWITVQEIKV